MSARYNPRKEHPIRRRAGFKPVKKTFLIVCEGVNTEPEYFNAFRLTSATVKAIGKGLLKCCFRFCFLFKAKLSPMQKQSLQRLKELSLLSLNHHHIHHTFHKMGGSAWRLNVGDTGQ